MSSSKLISDTLQRSARIRGAFHELNKYAAHPAYGVPLEQVKSALEAQKGAPPKSTPRQAPAENDLVGRLLQDNQDIWDQLCNHTFPHNVMGTMKTTDPGYKNAVAGFAWYMVQDFKYCTREMVFQIERATKSTSTDEFTATTAKVKNYCGYVDDSLALCVAAPPAGLGLNDKQVLQADSTDALNYYTDFQLITAKDNNWALGLVAMIPCVQSYWTIANSLKNNPDVDRIWYNLWIAPNSDYANSGIPGQIAFFEQNYVEWKDHYEEAKEIFRQACMGEINLWGITANPPSWLNVQKN
ncbi:uncharacterized protein FIBRA_02671 [Fibroporia radiculosa]|uniref:Thiaminase-2/PQQC domain-containing protein n=1 Tax=Fibroporia radiculosa TaxID=599839 RepID=J4H1Z5_9APHY|nr:uncharacterized protein FIBRA_02671 [Fibroporia radiculosa]CCM00634.1 predicted protein [Fibroporia radiculosa]